jgi:hypothetical protein
MLLDGVGFEDPAVLENGSLHGGAVAPGTSSMNRYGGEMLELGQNEIFIWSLG